MIELVILACLISNPTDCRPPRIPFDGGLFQCGIFGQADVAKWQTEHPKWRFKRYRCGVVKGRDA